MGEDLDRRHWRLLAAADFALSIGEDANVLAGTVLREEAAGDSAARRAAVEVMERTALKRVGPPEDISGAALYLASDASSFLTGHVLTVDAGWTVGI